MRAGKVGSVDITVQYLALSCDERGIYRSNVFCKDVVHIQLAATFMRLPSWHLAATSGLSSMGKGTGILGGSQLSFDENNSLTPYHGHLILKAGIVQVLHMWSIEPLKFSLILYKYSSCGYIRSGNWFQTRM